MTTKITVDNVLADSINIDKLSDVDTTTTAPTSGNLLTWNAATSKWVPAAPGGGVTIGKSIAMAMIFGG